MAGVWSAWKNPKTEAWEDTFAILTGDANSVMRPVHDRQPIILEPRGYTEYLTPTERPPIHLLRTLPAGELKSQLISSENITEQQVSLFDSH